MPANGSHSVPSDMPSDARYSDIWVGFINPVSEPFCSDCNRLRLTADGKLRTCLFSRRETDLRAPLRAGASDAQLAEVIEAAVWRKELKHHVGEPGFVPPPRTMSQIGG